MGIIFASKNGAHVLFCFAKRGSPPNLRSKSHVRTHVRACEASASERSTHQLANERVICCANGGRHVFCEVKITVKQLCGAEIITGGATFHEMWGEITLVGLNFT